MKTIGYYCNMIICVLLAAAFTACDKDAHEGEYPLGSGEGAFIVGLQSETEPEDLSLYFFGEDGSVALRRDYADPRTLASEYIPVPAGAYTLVVVANVAADDLPEQTTVADLADRLRENAADYPNLLTAASQESVAEGEVKRLLLTLESGTAGIGLSTVRLLLTVPGKQMPPYTATRAGSDAYTLRCGAEAYRPGTDTRVHRRVQLCTAQDDGTYLAELSLQQGDYDLRLWADWTSDGTTDDKYYNADDLSAVTVLTDNYVANGLTDEKDAYYASLSLTLPRGEGTQTGEGNPSSPTEGVEGAAVSLTRPFARYRLIANDVEGYLNLIANGEDYPPVEDLQVLITYEGFFPTGFDVATGKPNDALNTGIHYTTAPVAATGYPEGEARQIGSDFVLTNGEESFVTVTIQMIDPRTGGDISTVSGIKIPYRRGHLTTVTGRFLTAGKTTGGVEVDDDWGNDITIDF